MGTASDSLVSKYPDRISQLKAPVYEYLKKLGPYNGTEQDLYMAVFYPAARKVPADTPFSRIVPEKYYKKFIQQNPGIFSPADYIRLVNNRKSAAKLTVEETSALRDTASKLGVTEASLYKLINFESGWNPGATNPHTGARGLIQFMPKTSEWLGFAKTNFIPVIIICIAVLYMIKKYKML